jgi:hypothetical protein
MGNMRYSIVMEKDGFTYNYHGCNKYGKPEFYYGYASFDTRYYWRVYKSRKVAENELAKILNRRRMWSVGSESIYVKEWDLNKKEE